MFAKTFTSLIAAALLAAQGQVAQAQFGPHQGPVTVPGIPGQTPPVRPDLGPRIVIPPEIGRRLMELRDRRIALPAIGSCTVYDEQGFRGAQKSFTTIRIPESQFRVPNDHYHLFTYVGDDWNNRISSYNCQDACFMVAHDRFPATPTSQRFMGNQRESLDSTFDNAISAVLVVCARPG